MTEAPLAGFGVLLTRPSHQAAELADAVKAGGGTVFEFPVIEIAPRDVESISSDAAQLPSADIVVFISSNAVACGLAHVACDGAAIAAIGPATRAALEAAGQEVDIAPVTGFDSERLLEAPELADVHGQTVRIVRGSKGRELLATVLRDRGARVDYISVYDRRPVAHSAQQLSSIENAWDSGLISSVIAMSVDSLNMLVAALPRSCIDRLWKTPLVTPSSRVIQTANELMPGADTVLANGPGAREMFQALAATADRQ
jgi:uroporphyrinogen-III synthase